MHWYQNFIFVMFSEPEKRYHRNPSLARRGTSSFYIISLRLCSIFSVIQMCCYKQICVKYTEQKKQQQKTSHAFLRAFQKKYIIFRYRQVCILCDRYQAIRCTNSFFISTNFRRVSPIGLNARNHIENTKFACASSLFITWASSGFYHQSDTL